MNHIRLIVIMTAIFATNDCLAADVTTSVSVPPWMRIDGEIVEGDFRSVFGWMRYGITTVELDSPGGDVEEAMRIGRLLRRFYIRTLVPPDAQCNSVCFLIWAAGVERVAMSPIGLHRPYFERAYYAGLSAPEAEAQYADVMDQIDPYLEEMGIPIDVSEQMMRTRSTEVSLVSAQEIVRRVGEFHIPYNEWIIAQCGDLSDDEWEDYFAAGAVASKDELQESLDKSTDPNEIASLSHDLNIAKRFSAHVESMSNGYKKYLLEKGMEIQICTATSASDARQKIDSEIYEWINACVNKNWPEDVDDDGGIWEDTRGYKACSDEVVNQY